MAGIQGADALVFGVLLAFAVCGVCLTPISFGDLSALFKRPPKGKVGGRK